jgi:hypothetical protein
MRHALITLAALAVTTASSTATPPPIMHSTEFRYPVCLGIPSTVDTRFAQTEDDGGWFRRPPCKATDIGWIDENHVAHFHATTVQLEFALVKMLGEFYGLPIKPGR